ncbi:hypothetical protein [Methanoregula sp.]|uniref:hypothetical protein n=1 Tax=Methanoregula sp. TaxID=2052170 RepID=UPI00236C5FF9|nr:hypothetical protein [Methanoregula sp.]MDD1687022.1 hypothetical protein [Methanoregula sp.]
MSESAKSPLANLVLFMICLSVAGAFIAGVHYYAVDLPQQKNVQVPSNECMYTYEQCTYDYSNNRWVSLCCYKDCCTSIAEMDSALQWKD